MGRGRSSKAQRVVEPKSSRFTPTRRPPFRPYEEDGVRYSGLETEGMKTFKCSLLFPRDREVCPQVVRLDPQTVTLFRDRHYHSTNASAHFPGATVLYLEVKGKGPEHAMPEILTVGGKCRFTKQCLKEYGMMMRTNAEARRQGIPANGEFDWPDVRCLQLCPVCENMAQAGDGKVYWMLYYPLLQLAPSSANIGMRTVQRLACASCMESLLEGMFCASPLTGENKSMFQVLDQDLPAVTFLDGATDPILANRQNTTNLDSWTLYSECWDRSGAWEANENHRKSILQDIMGGSWKPNPDHTTGQGVMTVDLKQVHKQLDDTCRFCVQKMESNNVMLCSRCKKAPYCSRECQRQDWKKHKRQCTPASGKK